MVCDTFPDDFYIATAPHYAGPWTIRHSLSGCDEASTTTHLPGFHCNTSWPNAKTPTNPGGSMMEDPFHWIDNRGNWHILAHQYISLSPHSFEDPVSGHAFSPPDGTNWTWSTAQPFNGNVCEALHKPGSPFTSPCGSRERPFLLFDDSMQPTHLISAINSVCQGGNKDSTGKDWVYTAVQPIRAPSLKNDDFDSTVSSVAQDHVRGTGGNAAIAELDCAMRKLAYEYGAEILAAAHSDSAVRLEQLKAALLWPSSMVTQYCNETEFVLKEAAFGTLGAEQPQTGAAIFVSDSNGSDTAAGTLAAPFKTLQRAQTQVRSIIAGGRQPIVVNVRAGLYEINSTLTFGPQDGGTVDAPVLWTAYQHEAVVISGGMRLDDLQWEPAGVASRSPRLGAQVMKATLPAQVAVPAENWTSLFVGSKRAIWARWPNGDPSADSGLCLRRAAGQIDPHTGNLSQNSHPSAHQWDPKFPAYTASCTDPVRSMPNTAGRMGWATAGAGPFAEWQWPTNATSVKGTPTGSKSRTGPTYSGFNSCTGGAAARYTPPFNTWCCGGGSNVRTGLATAPRKLLPSGKFFQELGTPGMNWTRTDRAVVQMFHPLLWGWWAFSVKHASTATGLVNFSAGGWQEARGGGIGEHFYIEGLLEELDYEREWHARDSTLYYMPAVGESVDNGHLGIETTAGWTKQAVTIPVLETVLAVMGTMTKPVQHLHFKGLTITHSTTTYMEPYEVPSGGDWALHRGAAVVVEGAEDIQISNCTFDQPGGNGLLLSDYTRNCSITSNDFGFSGDSAIVSVGRAQRLVDPENHTDGLFPAGNLVSHNYIHDVGVFGKQVSCYFQSKSCGNTVEFNICANGPRDSINFDDGFAGFNTIRGNLVFNAVSS
jgi:hypothetical protein